MMKNNNFEFIDNENLKIVEIEEKIKNSFLNIQSSKNYIEIENEFNFLEKLQCYLSRKYFVDKIEINQYIRQFIRFFERLDDYENRQYLFRKIKNGVDENFSDF